eukprot:GHVU01233034.1.p1 GENE.GHVU01233034.1~~GHVU01233034.1.p1  ORF type:complete len:243 (+),score=22.45 GHVU01233034.1:688-1416(+)
MLASCFARWLLFLPLVDNFPASGEQSPTAMQSSTDNTAARFRHIMSLRRDPSVQVFRAGTVQFRTEREERGVLRGDSMRSGRGVAPMSPGSEPGPRTSLRGMLAMPADNVVDSILGEDYDELFGGLDESENVEELREALDTAKMQLNYLSGVIEQLHGVVKPLQVSYVDAVEDKERAVRKLTETEAAKTRLEQNLKALETSIEFGNQTRRRTSAGSGMSSQVIRYSLGEFLSAFLYARCSLQ